MTNTNPIQLAIVDDQKLFLKGLKFIINDFENVELMMEASNGQELIDQLAQRQPDVILMDLKMPVMDGLEATNYVKNHYPEVKIILLTMYNEERLINHMMKIGANGYLLKDEEPEEVRAAIEAVMDKGFYFNDYVSKALLKGLKGNQKTDFQSFPTNTATQQVLSRREIEVLQLICQEMTTSEIAQRLFISKRTVEGHRKKLLEKTGVKNTAGLAIYAYRNGLIQDL